MEDFPWRWVIIVVISVCLFKYIGSDSVQNKIIEINKRHEAEDKACRQPKLVSEVDGVKLYAYHRGCNDEHPVYFSKSGTSQTEEHCTNGPYGRENCHIITKEVPNSN